MTAMTGVTTHVLDLARGRPAAGMRVDLYWLGSSGGPSAVAEDDSAATERTLVTTVVTNEQGRCDAPLVAPPDLHRGYYELVFHVGSYLAATGAAVVEPPFLDRVPVRFGVHDPQAHYHVPLLVSPWAYSTYRGS